MTTYVSCLKSEVLLFIISTDSLIHDDKCMYVKFTLKPPYSFHLPT